MVAIQVFELFNNGDYNECHQGRLEPAEVRRQGELIFRSQRSLDADTIRTGDPWEK